uniref:PDZ and pleckstrin homology domains 1 n=1 Tax=Lates calcarifer TaxID=8187 RepID=A0A4W6ENC4_LATCA
MKINCSGSNVKLEIEEILQLNTSDIKTTFVFMNENGSCADTVFKNKCESMWISNNESSEQPTEIMTNHNGNQNTNYRFTFSSTNNQSHTDAKSAGPTKIWDSPNYCQCCNNYKQQISADFMLANHPSSPSTQLNVKPQEKRKHFYKSFSNDQLWDIPPPQEFADTLEDLALDLACCRIGTCSSADKQQEQFQTTQNITRIEESARSFSVEEDRADLAPSFDQLSESDNYEPMFMGSSLCTNRSSFTKEFISCQKRKSWIRNNSIATVEHRACPLPKKRRQTFPGMSEGLGLMQEDLLLPYSESFSYLTMCLLPLQTERLEKFHPGNGKSSAFGIGNYNSSQTKGSSKPVPEMPDSHDGEQSLLSPFCMTSSEDNPDDVFTASEQCRTQSSITCHCKDLKQSICKDMESLDTDDCEYKVDQSELADSGYDQEIGEVEYHSPEPLTEEVSRRALSIQIIPPSCSGSEEHILQHPVIVFQNNKVENLNICMKCIYEYYSSFIATLEAKEHLKPVIHTDPDSSGSEHWAKRRKLFKESKQWNSAGGSSVTSDITEDSVSEDTRSTDMTVRDNEDRGFYMETFHSSAWIYQGDDAGSAAIPPSLNTRTRAVSIRERTVKINKGTGEYPWGFRIQFSKPIVVTEVDTNGAAEEAGLMVGDYVLAVNGIDVTSIPHSEAADLARQGPDVLTLTIGSDIARGPNTPRPACRGYLHKRTQSGLIKGWRKRWFVLTHDCCLYYYRHKRDEGKRQALSAVKLEGAEVGQDISLGKPFVFKCRPQSGNRVYFFCATSNQEMKRWLEAMERAIHPLAQNHVWVDVTRHNSNLPPLAVKNPECLGLLHKMDKNKDIWVQHYCILKDGCLYLYSSIRATHAHGGIYLQGYTVREQPYGFKKSTIELKPLSDEFKTFHLCAENPNENKRWIIAIKASIKKWLPLHQALQDYMNRPAEETRM